MYKLNTSSLFKFSLNLITFILFIWVLPSKAQKKQYQAATIGFYNVENLFDTIHTAGYIDGTKDFQDQFYHISINRNKIAEYEKDTVMCKCSYTEENLKGKKVIRPLILVDEFTPDGPKAWNSEKYNQKLKNLSKVISEMGAEITKTPPVIVGLVEVETRQVIQDLVVQPRLKPYDYGIVHYNSFDKRGIDVGLIYQKQRFRVLHTQKYVLKINNPDGNRDYTRDILRVDGELDGEKIHILVNHWPSRRGGEAVSAPKRAAAGELLKKIFDEIIEEEPDAKVIAMGDFNDDPTDKSMTEALGAVGSDKDLGKYGLYNAMIPLFKKGQGTLAYRDGWNLFDQMIFTSGLIGNSYKTYQRYKTAIFSPSYLISQEGAYKGYPNRMFGGNNYRANGYSDHFPVYSILLREVNP